VRKWAVELISEAASDIFQLIDDINKNERNEANQI
jgi:hypothetical protein